MLFVMMFLDSASKTISKPPFKSLILEVGLIMVSLHSSGKVIKTQYHNFGYAGMLCPQFQEYGDRKIPGAH